MEREIERGGGKEMEREIERGEGGRELMCVFVCVYVCVCVCVCVYVCVCMCVHYLHTCLTNIYLS